MIPFPPLTYLSAHKKELFAGMPVHVTIQCPEVCKSLRDVSRHLIKERTLPMYHLVMGENKDEVLGKGIKKTECQVVMLVFPVDRVLGEIPQCVVHPSHIPLQAEAKASQVCGPGYTSPCCRLLSNGQHSRGGRMEDLIESLE